MSASSVMQRVSHVRCTGPRGGQVDVPGTLAVLPRRQLDPDEVLTEHGHRSVVDRAQKGLQVFF